MTEKIKKKRRKREQKQRTKIERKKIFFGETKSMKLNIFGQKTYAFSDSFHLFFT